MVDSTEDGPNLKLFVKRFKNAELLKVVEILYVLRENSFEIS